MKKILWTLLLCMGFVLAGCQTDPAPALPGQLYDTGCFQVQIPDGWGALEVTDPFSEPPNAVKPDALFLIKGGSREQDLHSKLYLRVEYYGEDGALPTSDGYENVAPIAPFVAGGYTWSGFTCDEYQGRVYFGKTFCLWTEDGRFVVAGTLERERQKITMEDPDLRMILGSLQQREE